MGAKASANKMYQLSSDIICRALADSRFSSPLRIDFVGTNPVIGGTCFQFRHGVTFFSWGELITITVYPRSESLTEVVFYSECTVRLEFLDWGKNKSNVSVMMDQLDRLLATYSNYGASGSYSGSSQGAAFCPACGKNVRPQDIFCSNCGRKLK